MALQVGELYAALGLEARDFNQGLDNAENRLRQAGNNMGKSITNAGKSMAKAGAIMTAAITVPIVAMGKNMIENGMNAIEMANMFDVSFGDMKDIARSWAIDTAKNLGINKYAMQENMAQMHDLVKTMGITGQSGLEMSEQMSKLAYDLASFKNIGVEEAFQKLRSGITGESEPLKAIGILVNETTVATYAYTHGIAEQGKKLTEQQKVMARYGLIMEQTADAQGDLARTMDSPANKLRILQERVAELSTELGIRLLPIVSKLLTVLLQLANWFGNLPEPIQNTILAIAGILAVIGPLLVIIGSITSAIGSLVTAFSAGGWAMTALTAIGSALSTLWTTVLVPAGEALIAVLAGISAPVWIVIGIIAALIAIGVLLYKNWDAVKAWLIQAWEAIKAAAVAVWTGIIQFFTVTVPQALTALIDWFAQLPGRIGAWLAQLPERMAYFLGLMIGTAIRLTIALITAVVKFFSELPGKVATWLVTTWENIKTFFTNMKTSAINLTIALVNGVINFFATLPGRILSFITNIASGIKNGFENAKNWAVNAVRNLYNGISSIISGIPGIFSNIFNKVMSFLSNLPSALWNKAKSIASSFWEGFKNGLGIHSPSYVEKAFDAMTANMGDNLYDMKRLIPQFQNALTPAFAGLSNGVDLPQPAITQRAAQTTNGAGIPGTGETGNADNNTTQPNINVTVITDWKGAVKEIKTDIAKDTNSKNRVRG